MAASVHRSFVERIPGFEVVGEATTGQDALRLVDELHPELVLLDIYLPDIGGLEVTRRLREREEEVDVIAITSAKDVKTLRGAMHSGVVHYLVKPFTFATFRERLESYAALRARPGRLHDGERAVEVNLDRAPVGLRHRHLVARAGVVGRDRSRGSAADGRDSCGPSLGGRVAGDGLLRVLVRRGAVRREAVGRR